MAQPTRDAVKTQVLEFLSHNTYKEPIEEKDELETELKISKGWRKHFAFPLSKISESYEGGLPVYKYEAEALQTVKETIDLTFKRAKGKA